MSFSERLNCSWLKLTLKNEGEVGLWPCQTSADHRFTSWISSLALWVKTHLTDEENEGRRDEVTSLACGTARICAQGLWTLKLNLFLWFDQWGPAQRLYHDWDTVRDALGAMSLTAPLPNAAVQNLVSEILKCHSQSCVWCGCPPRPTSHRNSFICLTQELPLTSLHASNKAFEMLE